MTTISDNVKNQIRKNSALTGQLMAVFNKTQNTIWNWVDSDDPRLTSKDAVDVISRVMGLSVDEILESECKSDNEKSQYHKLGI